MYFPDTAIGELYKQMMTEEIEAEFEVSRMIEAKYEVKIEPAKDEDAIIQDENEAIISKGTVTQKVTFDPELVANLITKETDPEILQMLEHILTNNPNGKFDETGIIGEGIDADLSPIHLKRVNNKWKMIPF
ncbi:MAG: hypothetical protein GX962_14660 [Epulopiscium sp.]|nr:hypothetical protein [Candidatus Epulonipiscium sp.]